MWELCERNGKKVVFCPKIVRFMKAFNFEQRKESELQKFVGLKGNVVEWRYGYVEEKFIVYTSWNHAERAADKSGGMNTPQEKKEDVYEFVDHHAAVQQCKRERKEH